LNAEPAFLGRANVPSDVRAAWVAVIYAAVAMPAFLVALGVRFAPPAFMRGPFAKWKELDGGRFGALSLNGQGLY
jgi:hypothetical protein